MTLPALYSRKKRQSLGPIDVYQYEEISPKLRQQIVLMISETDAEIEEEYGSSVYPKLVRLLRKETGTSKLSKGHDNQNEFEIWFRSHHDIDEILDAIQIASALLELEASRVRCTNTTKQFIEELNARMLEAGFGFQIERSQVIKVNDQFAHADIVLPALQLLSNSSYKSADIEFRQAHAEFRAGQYEDCIHDCANAFESVLKIVFTKKGWTFSANDPASKLIAVAFSNNLIPEYMQNEFAGLRMILENGTPTIRNKNGGHGAGPNPRNIPSYIASFQLHQTAAAILLLIEAAK